MTPERGQGLDAARRDGDQVVGGERPELGGQLGAARVHELVGVEPRREAVADAGLEHPARLLGGEKTPCSQKTSQKRARPCRRGGRHDLLADQVEVAVAVAAGARAASRGRP